MNIHDTVVAALLATAPEVAEDLADLDPEADLQDELDLDSMDLLTFYGEVSERFGIDIPERDYGKLSSLAAVETYVARTTSNA